MQGVFQLVHGPLMGLFLLTRAPPAFQWKMVDWGVAVLVDSLYGAVDTQVLVKGNARCAKRAVRGLVPTPRYPPFGTQTPRYLLI